jgi:hypothetical protein
MLGALCRALLCIASKHASASQAKLDCALHVALRHPQRPLRLHPCEPHACKHLQRCRRHVLLLLLRSATPLLLLMLLLAWPLLLLLLWTPRPLLLLLLLAQLYRAIQALLLLLLGTRQPLLFQPQSGLQAL